MTWDYHILLLNKTLHLLEANVFTANLFKYKIQMICSGNWLAWILAHTHGVKTKELKNECILQMQKPTNLSQILKFLGAVNHCHLMWPQHAHILTPLSSDAGKKTFCWTTKFDLAFKCMKGLIVQGCLLAYSNCNKPFTKTLMLLVIKWKLILYKIINLWPSGQIKA